MARNPAFLLYSQDFLIGCAEMTHEEIGQYFRILCYMHQKGRMEEKTIRLLVGSLLDTVKAKFEIDSDGFWFNIKLEEIVADRQKFVESRKNNGSRGGRPKKHDDSQNLMVSRSLTYAKATEDEIEDENNLLKEDNNKDDLIQKVWIQTWGRNPSLPEREETETLIKKFGIEKIKKEMKRANLKGFKNYGTFLERLDETGTLILDDRNNGQTQITTTLPTSKLSPDMEKQRDMLSEEKQKRDVERTNKFNADLQKFKEDNIDS